MGAGKRAPLPSTLTPAAIAAKKQIPINTMFTRRGGFGVGLRAAIADAARALTAAIKMTAAHESILAKCSIRSYSEGARITVLRFMSALPFLSPNSMLQVVLPTFLIVRAPSSMIENFSQPLVGCTCCVRA